MPRSLDIPSTVANDDVIHVEFFNQYSIYYSNAVLQKTEGFSDNTPLPPPLNMTSKSEKLATIVSYASWYSALDKNQLSKGFYSFTVEGEIITPPLPIELT